MSQSRDSSPVYYREIQKNDYLKRIADEPSGKLRPLALKKAPPKPMWTQLCVHNGRTPYLEQYRDPVSARAHRPTWRASLAGARHVTASVTPRHTDYDFLIDTHHGPIRMLAPNWESMQDWVTTLRNKLHELKIVSLCENVYMAPPAPPPPRAAARDPTSPLPPTPPAPPDRVPGIDLTTVTRVPTIPENPAETTTANQSTAPDDRQIDISNWDDDSLPSTSSAPTSVAKICGQNICLDDSIFKRDDDSDQYDDDDIFMQTVLVSEEPEETMIEPTNITVIQVSNKDPPHTAIPVIGTETDVFNFDFKTTPQTSNYVNIVNTENANSEYGTVFENESDYGHLSLTTTVNLTGAVSLADSNVNAKEDLYERLCMAETSASPLPIRRLKCQEKQRKSSLPNLDTANTTYEYLFLGQNASPVPVNSSTNATSTNIVSTNNLSMSPNSTSISSNSTFGNSPIISENSASISGNSAVISSNGASIPGNSTSVSGNSAPLSENIAVISSNSASMSGNSASISGNSTLISSNSISTNSTSNSATVITNSSSNISTALTSSNSQVTVNSNSQVITNGRHVNSVCVNNVNSNTRSVRSNIERTQSDASNTPRHNGPKSNIKEDKNEPQHKPIWKRGLTELSLLTRLRIGQGRRPESPNRNDTSERNGNTAAKVVHRSRPEARPDRSRRRSSSLSNGHSPPTAAPTPLQLQPLRARQAAALVAAQRRGAAVAAGLSPADTPVFADYNKQVWVAWWGGGGARCGGRSGDRVCGLRACAPRDAAHARQLLHSAHARAVDILFHRVPLGNIYVVNKRDQESIGLKLDNECNITGIEADSPAARAGIPPPGKWAVTEVNNRPVNLVKGGEEDMNRICQHGTEASILIQPSALVKKLRAALKGNKTLLGLR